LICQCILKYIFKFDSQSLEIDNYHWDQEILAIIRYGR
jgi:hypothetical protein